MSQSIQPVPPSGIPERDLHDQTIQALYGISLQLENCIHLIEESSGQAKEELDAAIGAVGQVIDEVRRRIYELGSGSAAAPSGGLPSEITDADGR